MKHILLVFFAFIIVFSSVAQKTKVVAKVQNSGDYLPGKIIVKLKASGSQTKTLSSDIFNLPSVRFENISQKFPVSKNKISASTLKLQENYGLSRIYELSVSSDKSIPEIIEELKKNSAVEYAEPLYIHHTEYIPNDSQHNTVQSYLNQVRAQQSWDLIRNDNKVIIAIVDSGSDLDHEDLAANIHTNILDPVNGIDDDGDGYIDNFRGWDFVGPSDNNIVEDNNPNITQDGGDHGVHVSGIASSVTDNGKGVSSVAFNCAKLMILKVASDANGTDIVRGYEGVKYAADHGAQIINCSWGSENQSYYGQDIINYAIAKGCLVVAAAGNSGSNVPQYPSGYAGVIAVANVLASDSKASTSNYGSYVTIAAPGTSIWSTILDVYGSKSGTSMASPVVASAAALLKAYRPNLTMLQVGEQLRATADNIDAQNPAFTNQLGKGRLNVYRALTESQPSIKKQSITITDKSHGTFPSGDTLTIYASFKNFLSPVTNLKITLKTDDENLTVTVPQQTIANLNTLATQNNVGPFKVYIKPGIPENYAADLRFEYSANNNTYSDFEGFTVQLNRDYINLETSTIATTVTSKGTIGFLQAGGEDGTRGFQYKDEQLLYEASLMIGNSSNKVSNNARSAEGSTDDHFAKQVRIRGIATADTLRAIAEFDDSNSPNPLNVYVTQRSLVVKNGIKDNYLITEYEVKNKSNFVLNNLYIGMFNDWDINGGANNATEFDSEKNIAYVYDKTGGNFPYAAVKLLSNANPAYYPLTNRLSGNILANDNFTTAEKYTTLSNGISSNSLAVDGNGTDISFVVGYGPFSLLPKESAKAAFSFIGGENKTIIEQTANQSLSIYQTVKLDTVPSAVIPIAPVVDQLSLYSFTIDGMPYVKISLPEKAYVTLELYSINGKRVQVIEADNYVKGIHPIPVYGTQGLASGTYFYRLTANGKIKTFKTTIIN